MDSLAPPEAGPTTTESINPYTNPTDSLTNIRTRKRAYIARRCDTAQKPRCDTEVDHTQLPVRSSGRTLDVRGLLNYVDTENILRDVVWTRGAVELNMYIPPY